jgi:hypothetical protein
MRRIYDDLVYISFFCCWFVIFVCMWFLCIYIFRVTGVVVSNLLSVTFQTGRQAFRWKG